MTAGTMEIKMITPKTRTQIGAVALAGVIFLGSEAIVGHDAYVQMLPYMLAALIVGHIQGRCSSPFKPEEHV